MDQIIIHSIVIGLLLRFQIPDHVALPVSPGYTVRSGQISGLVEVLLQLHFRIQDGKNDQDVSHLDVVASPHLFPAYKI